MRKPFQKPPISTGRAASFTLHDALFFAGFMVGILLFFLIFGNSDGIAALKNKNDEIGFGWRNIVKEK